ncbi:MAG: stage III sporulation protein AA [Huintestinicola sp.]
MDMGIRSAAPHYFSSPIAKALMSCVKANEIMEVRLRANSPLAVTMTDRYAYIDACGCITEKREHAVIVTSEDVKRSFEAICRYSVYSCQNQINHGFITVNGGHRAGICGTAVNDTDGRTGNIRNISSINFRVAHQIIGSGDEIYENMLSDGSPQGFLICGAPCSGKTTMLRDVCRRIGDIYPVSLIDERGELAASSGGVPQNDIGANTDVFNGYSKKEGIISAVRSMSPVMIFCDEIGSEEDISAIMTASLSGVKTAASVHCSSVDELRQRESIMKLFRCGAVSKAFLLRNRHLVRICSAEELLAGEAI